MEPGPFFGRYRGEEKRILEAGGPKLLMGLIRSETDELFRRIGFETSEDESAQAAAGCTAYSLRISLRSFRDGVNTAPPTPHTMDPHTR